MTALATDSFTRANETPLGTNWSTQTSEVGIDLVSNKAQNHADNADEASNYNAIAWPNDQYSQSVLTAAAGYSLGDGPGPGVRMSSSAQTYYRVTVTHITGSNNVEIARKLTGGYAMIAQRNSGAWVDGAVWYVEVQSTTLIVKVNGVQVGASATNNEIGSGRAGLVYSSENAGKTSTWDDWEGGDFAAAGGTAVEPSRRRTLVGAGI